MIIKIRKYSDVSEKIWYQTNFDAEMSFSKTYQSIDKNIIQKYFQKTINGGSYALSFNSKNLEKILKILPLDCEIKFIKNVGFLSELKITKKEFKNCSVDANYNKTEVAFNQTINKR